MKDFGLSRRHVVLGAAAGALGLPGCATFAPPKQHFVLVHGSWHGAWCWNKVVPLLRAAGHKVTAIDLPGRGGDPQQLARLTTQDYATAATNVLDASPEPVILVGHSLGGGTISLAAEARPEKVKTLVYLTAFLVPDGKTIGSIAMGDRGSLAAKAIRRDPSTGVSSLDPAHVKEVFYQDCTDEDVEFAKRMVTPEPPAMAVTPIRISNERFGTVDRVYIECLKDRTISIATQRSMQAALPCRRVFTLDTSHSPFFADPAGLSKILLSI